MKKIRPHHLILGFWVLLATAFGLSGVVSAITQQHDDSPVSREVFGNIPSAWKLLVYTFAVASLLYVGTQFSYRFRNWERGGPDRRPLTSRTPSAASATSAPGCTCRPCCATPPPG